MSKQRKNITLESNHVIANLVATYDISHANAKSVASIDYLCIYEYEYDGKKFKYRTHQRDNFSPIPETIELCFKKDPTKAYKVNNSSNNDYFKKSSGVDFFSLIWIGLIVAVLLIIYFIYNMFKEFSEFEIIPFLLIFICLIIIANRKTIKIQKIANNRDAMIEDAMLNNRTVTAYLIKTKSRRWTNKPNNSRLQVHYKEFPYTGKYTYNYNGKKYNKTFEFSSTPPRSLRLFFNKNPKNVIHFTSNT